MAQIIRMGTKTTMRAILFKCSCGCEFKEDYDVCTHYTTHEKVYQPATSEQDEWDKCNGYDSWYKDVSTDMHSTTCPCCHKTVEVTDEHYTQQCHYEFDEETQANPDNYELNRIKKGILNKVDFEGRDTKILDTYITTAFEDSGVNEMRELMRKHKITVESLIGRPYKYDISLDYSKPDYLRMGVEIYELIYPTKFPRSKEYMNTRNTFVRDFIAYSNNPKVSGCDIFWPYKTIVEGGEIKPTETTKQLWNEFSDFLANRYSESEKELLGKFLCVNNAISTLVDEHHLDFKGVLEYIQFNGHDESFSNHNDSMYYKEMTHNERVMKREMEQQQIENYVALSKKMKALDPERDALVAKEEELNHLLWTDALDKVTTIIRPIDFDDETEIESFWKEQLFKIIWVKNKKIGEKAEKVMFIDYQQVMKERFDMVKNSKYFSTKEAHYKKIDEAKNELKTVQEKLKEINKVYVPLFWEERKLRGKMEYTTWRIAEEKCKE